MISSWRCGRFAAVILAVAAPSTGLAQQLEYDAGHDVVALGGDVVSVEANRPGDELQDYVRAPWGRTVPISGILSSGAWSYTDSTLSSGLVGAGYCGGSGDVRTAGSDDSTLTVYGDDQIISVNAFTMGTLEASGKNDGRCVDPHYSQVGKLAMGIDVVIPFVSTNAGAEVSVSTTSSAAQDGATSPFVSSSGTVRLVWAVYEDRDTDGQLGAADVQLDSRNLIDNWGGSNSTVPIVVSASQKELLLVVRITTYASIAPGAIGAHYRDWDPLWNYAAEFSLQLRPL